MATVRRPSQRVAQREATRHAILAAARALFRVSGVDTVSMDDIARAAAVARATVYLHFSGKQAVLVELLAQDWERQARLFEQLGRVAAPDGQAITTWLGRAIEGMRKARDSFAIHRVALGQDETMSARHREHRQRLASLLRGGPTDAADDAGRRVEAVMIVAEIEHLAAAAVSEWSMEETAAATAIVTGRLARFLAAHRALLDNSPAS